MRAFEQLLSRLHAGESFVIGSDANINALCARAEAFGFATRVNERFVWSVPHESLFVSPVADYESIKLRWSVVSTQKLIASLADVHEKCVLAEHQFGGIGRHGRIWSSIPCCNLYLSYGYISKTLGNQNTREIPLLSLAVAVILVDLLVMFGLKNISIKWPNDVLVDNKKIAGVLIDSEIANTSRFLIGIGLNCHKPQCEQNINQPWTYMDAHCAEKVDRAQVAISLYRALLTQLPLFFACGFAVFYHRFCQYDGLVGRDILLNHAAGGVRGQYLGINMDGSINLKQENGIIATYSAPLSCSVL